MHLMKLTFWQNGILQFVLINGTFYANLHHQIHFIVILEIVQYFLSHVQVNVQVS